MSKHRPLLVAVVLFVGFATTARSQLSQQGIVDSAGLSTCQQGSHLLIDPCTGAVLTLDSSLIDLDSVLCESGLLQGPDVGVECTVMSVQDFVPLPPVCVPRVRDLRVRQTFDDRTFVLWSDILSPKSSCVAGYDLIQGRFPLPAQGDLGEVTCLLDNSSTTNWLSPVPELPQPGELFFFVARPIGPLGNPDYGTSSAGAVRMPSAGDCPLGGH